MSPWRRWCSRWSGAEAALAIAWGAFASGLLAAALARDSVGILVPAAFCAWQMCDVWVAVHGHPDPAERERDTRSPAVDRKVGVPPRPLSWNLP
jgi:hypothetical protein